MPGTYTHKPPRGISLVSPSKVPISGAAHPWGVRDWATTTAVKEEHGSLERRTRGGGAFEAVAKRRTEKKAGTGCVGHPGGAPPKETQDNTNGPRQLTFLRCWMAPRGEDTVPARISFTLWPPRYLTYTLRWTGESPTHTTICSPGPPPRKATIKQGQAHRRRRKKQQAACMHTHSGFQVKTTRTHDKRLVRRGMDVCMYRDFMFGNEKKVGCMHVYTYVRHLGRVYQQSQFRLLLLVSSRAAIYTYTGKTKRQEQRIKNARDDDEKTAVTFTLF